MAALVSQRLRGRCGIGVGVWESGCLLRRVEVREELVGVETGVTGWWRMQGAFQDAG